MTLDELNQLAPADAIEVFLKCCHSQRWAESMARARPFASEPELLEQADSLWADVSEADILEAFAGHPRIGDVDLLRSRYAGRAMKEQGQLLASEESVIRELHRLNVDYEQRHGFIFIVCASGKSAEQMLSLIRARIDRSRETELAQGAREQGAITRLRLIDLITNKE